ncbi:MAG: DUF4157 domain-containing protein, partial [Verrucomicrobiota bacterium]
MKAELQRKPNASLNSYQENQKTRSESTLQRLIDNSRVVQAQREDATRIFGSNESGVTQRSALPDNLRNGVEELSGVDLSDVSVHRNSNKPAQLNAKAYAQGSEIHLGPGQDQHLPHEAWHVAQQKQGRVSPTAQLQGVALNDDQGLEKEADVMGAKALQLRKDEDAAKSDRVISLRKDVAQRAPSEESLLDDQEREAAGNKTEKGEKKWTKWLKNAANFAKPNAKTNKWRLRAEVLGHFAAAGVLIAAAFGLGASLVGALPGVVLGIFGGFQAAIGVMKITRSFLDPKSTAFHTLISIEGALWAATAAGATAAAAATGGPALAAAIVGIVGGALKYGRGIAGILGYTKDHPWITGAVTLIEAVLGGISMGA